MYDMSAVCLSFLQQYRMYTAVTALARVSLTLSNCRTAFYSETVSLYLFYF